MSFLTVGVCMVEVGDRQLYSSAHRLSDQEASHLDLLEKSAHLPEIQDSCFGLREWLELCVVFPPRINWYLTF